MFYYIKLEGERRFWNMSLDSSDGIEKFTTSVAGLINKCIDNIVLTVTIHTYPNQKPWITGKIHTELKASGVGLNVDDTFRFNAFSCATD
jgi:hypothetical protein